MDSKQICFPQFRSFGEGPRNDLMEFVRSLGLEVTSCSANDNTIKVAARVARVTEAREDQIRSFGASLPVASHRLHSAAQVPKVDVTGAMAVSSGSSQGTTRRS